MATVEDILRQIAQLSEEDRRLFDQRMNEVRETEWRTLQEQASRIADERGIDQETIDRAIERHRYGS